MKSYRYKSTLTRQRNGLSFIFLSLCVLASACGLGGQTQQSLVITPNPLVLETYARSADFGVAGQALENATKVEFYLNDVLYSTQTNTPFIGNLGFYQAGKYSVTAKVTYKNGSIARFGPVNFEVRCVNQCPPPPPTQP